MKNLLVFVVGACVGSVGTATYWFVNFAKESYPEKTTWEAVKRQWDREMWAAVHD